MMSCKSFLTNHSKCLAGVEYLHTVYSILGFDKAWSTTSHSVQNTINILLLKAISPITMSILITLNFGECSLVVVANQHIGSTISTPPSISIPSNTENYHKGLVVQALEGKIERGWYKWKHL